VAKFDLVAALPHDRVSGENVVTLRAALHPVTPERLRLAREELGAQLNPHTAPLLGTLIGGDKSGHRLTESTVARLVCILKSAHSARGYRAAVTPSRRTNDAVRRALAEGLGSAPWAHVWNGEGPNPYLGILGLADRLIVTSDSISMISEALATGRPVHVLPLEGRRRRHGDFVRRMAEDRLVSMIAGDDLDWGFQGSAPINSAEEPARRLRAMLGLVP
jgi:mitochondrial fission protein ELM1